MPVSARHRLEWCLARTGVIDSAGSWFSWKCSGICKRLFFSGVFPDSQAVQVSAGGLPDNLGEQARAVVPVRQVLGVVLAGIPVDHGSAEDRPDSQAVQVSAEVHSDNPADLGHAVVPVHWCPDEERAGIHADHDSVAGHLGNLAVRTDGPVRQDLAGGLLRLVLVSGSLTRI